MTKTSGIIIVALTLLSFACESNRNENFERLKKSIPELDGLLHTIKTTFPQEFKRKQHLSRLVFSCEPKSFKSDDVICDSAISNRMGSLRITEVRFEKIEDSCKGANGFTQIWCKLKKDDLEEASYYLYEYCGSKKPYSSSTITYIPADDNWGLYVESN